MSVTYVPDTFFQPYIQYIFTLFMRINRSHTLRKMVSPWIRVGCGNTDWHTCYTQHPHQQWVTSSWRSFWLVSLCVTTDGMRNAGGWHWIINANCDIMRSRAASFQKMGMVFVKILFEFIFKNIFGGIHELFPFLMAKWFSMSWTWD